MILKLNWRASVESQPLNHVHSSPAGVKCLCLQCVYFLQVLPYVCHLKDLLIRSIRLETVFFFFFCQWLPWKPLAGRLLIQDQRPGGVTFHLESFPLGILRELVSCSSHCTHLYSSWPLCKPLDDEPAQSVNVLRHISLQLTGDVPRRCV